MGKKARAAKKNVARLQREQEDEASARKQLFGGPADGRLPVDGKSFARKLGASNWRVREKGIKLLEVWLTSKRHSSDATSQTQALSDDEWKRIWKGLFYCVWHSDKPLVQEALVKRLARVLFVLNVDVAVEYFRTCIVTLKREWSGIDRLRLDKFLLMIRHFVKCAMAYCAAYEWKTKVVMAFTAVLGKSCLFNNDYPASIGVVLQVVDVFLDEIEEIVEDSDHLSQDTISRLIMPFLVAVRRPGDSRILSRIQEKIILGLVQRVLDEDEPKHKAWENFNVSTLVEHIFEIASDPDTPQMNRGSLYETHAELKRICKKANLSLETEDPENDAPDEDELKDRNPSLNGEPVKSEGQNNGPSRKSKRNLNKLTSADDKVDSPKRSSKRQKALATPSKGADATGDQKALSPSSKTKKSSSVSTEKKSVKFGLANNEEIAANAPRRNLDYDPQKSPTSSAKGVLKKTSTPISDRKPSKPVKSRVRQRASLA